MPTIGASVMLPYKVAAIGRGAENAMLAKKLGATVYIDSKSTNAAEALLGLGGAQVILATAPSSKAMSELINGLGPNGKLIVVGVAFDPIEVTPVQLISGSRAIQGCLEIVTLLGTVRARRAIRWGIGSITPSRSRHTRRAGTLDRPTIQFFCYLRELGRQ